MADNDTDSSGPQAKDSDIKLTVYGYKGDSTPDYNSIVRHIGDHENPLTATEEHQSAALTWPQRERLFGPGYKHSTGMSFTYHGKTYYDDDTAPEGDYRIDVFDPSHPPDKLTPRSGYESTYPAPGQASKSPLLRSYWADEQAATEAPVQEEEPKQEYSKPREEEAPAEEPRRVGKPEESILAPENLLPKIRQNYPEYKGVSDPALWKSIKERYHTGLSQLRLAFPEYDQVDDKPFLQAIHQQYFPKDSDDQFTDRVNPPTGATGVYHAVAEQIPRIASGFQQKTGDVATFPQHVIGALDRVIRALGISQPPPLTKDQELVQKRLEQLGLKDTGNLTPLTKGLISGIVNPQTAQQMFVWGRKLEAKGGRYAQEHIPEPKGLAGQTAAKGFEAIGAAPGTAISFLGGEGAGGLLWGMAYDAIQGEGKAREKGLDNSLLFGGEGASYRALQQWLLYTPRGRMLSALLWAGSGVADQEAQAFLTDPKGTLDKAFKEPANTISDLTSTAAVNAMFGGLASLGVEKLRPEPRSAFEQAVKARERGDYREAAQLLDKTMLLLPEPVQKAATNNLLAWRNEAVEAAPSDAPLEMPGQRGFLTLNEAVLPPQAEVPAAPSARPTGFTTAKGSTYEFHEDGTTTRTKAPRPEHPGEGGLQPRSERTVFLTPYNADRLAPPQGSVRFVDHGDGTITIVTPAKGGKWGASASQRDVPYSETPTVGSIPLELSDTSKGVGYRAHHFGNPITEVRTEAQASDRATERITAAASRFGTTGHVYTGPTHNAALEVSDEARELPLGQVIEHGFVTNTGRFVNRDEAYKIAQAAKQALPGAVKGDIRAEELKAGEVTPAPTAPATPAAGGEVAVPEAPPRVPQEQVTEAQAVSDELETIEPPAVTQQPATDIPTALPSTQKPEALPEAHSENMRPLGYKAAVQLSNGEIFSGRDHAGALDNAAQNASIRVSDETTRYGFTDREGKFVTMDEADRILGEAIPKLESKSPSDAATDQFYYSGIDLGKMYEDFAKMLERWGVSSLLVPSIKAPREELRPQYEVAAEKAKAIIGKRIGIAQRDNARFAQSWYRQQKFGNHFKWAYETDQRTAFWDSIKEGKRRQMYEQHEAGLSTGNEVADRMWELHDGLMKAAARVNDARGFHHALRESYIAHILKNPDDIERLEADFVRMKWGDPSFMKAREIPTAEMVHALGYEFKYYNPERNDQAYIEGMNRAEAQAAMLEELHASEGAITKAELDELEKTNPRAAAEIREQLWKPTKAHPQAFWRSPKAKSDSDAHEIYYLHQSAGDLMARAMDPVHWPHFFGDLLSTAESIKQYTTGMNLGLSLYHPVHILGITWLDTVAHAFSSALARTGNFGDWGPALLDTTTFGGASHAIAMARERKLLRWFKARDARVLSELSPRDQELAHWMMEGGFTPLISHERQIQLYRRLISLRGKIPEKPGLDPVDLGYNLASSRWFQQWYFGTVVPSLKMMSFDRAAQAMFRGRPHLLRPEYELDRMQALRGIARQVDDRYGEQNLRQSFEEPHLKRLGTALLLSYSWLKSFIGTYGGGIHDMTKLAAERPPSRYGTNRVAFMLTLTAGSMAVNGAISQFLGDGIHGLMDLVWANTGKDQNGRPIRIKLPFWITTEFGGAYYDIEKGIQGQKGNVAKGTAAGLVTFFKNKMQPALFTLFELLDNHDYFGTQIGPDWDKNKNAYDNVLAWVTPRAQFSLRNFAPFTIQEFWRPNATAKDVILAMLGAPRAAKQTMRSAMENRILNEYVASHPKERTLDIQAQIDAKRAYRDAVQNGDRYAQEVAIAKMEELGISKKSIKETEATAQYSEAQRIFHHLSGVDQEKYWRDMTPADKALFEPLLHKKEKSLLSR